MHRNYILKELVNLGYIILINEVQPLHCVITSKGWERLAQLDKPKIDSKQAFVAMCFDKSVVPDDICNGIDKAIEDAGYEPLRINNKQHNNNIVDEIIAEIRKSRFMVADFTGHRGGVYYEAGFARGLNIPVIYIVQENDLNTLHFDTKQISHIVYHEAGDLYEKLRNRIMATI